MAQATKNDFQDQTRSIDNQTEAIKSLKKQFGDRLDKVVEATGNLARSIEEHERGLASAVREASEAAGKHARQLKIATWVLAFATIALVVATIAPLLARSS